MIYTDITKKAMRIAYEAHKEQTDYVKIPYIYHPIHLAEQMIDEVSVCAALLHDVVEDTELTFEELKLQGIPDEVIDVLKLLTHIDELPCLDYVMNIKKSKNKTAIAIKLADLLHNSDVTRFDVIDEESKIRNEKYHTAIQILMEK